MPRCLFAFMLALAAAWPVASETRWERSARQKREIAKDIVWFSHEPLAFMLRRGNHPENLPQTYERQHAPENVALMAKAGVRFGRLRFYKGLGMTAEAGEMAKSLALARNMHEHGMKVSLYVAGTMFAETFYREVPAARSWEQRDQNNRFVPYMETQTFRHYPCPNEPAYRTYMRQVLKRGVEEWKADQIFFDNVQLQPEPKSCRCPRCLNGFREYLRRKYPTEQAARRRFGYPTVDIIEPNEFEYYNRAEDIMTVTDPVMQEWIRYRCETLANHNIDMARYLRSLDPDLSIGFNLKGVYGFNRMWLNGIYHPLWEGHSDFLCFDVGGMDSRLEPRTGALISEIRSYKLARRLNMSCHETVDDELHMAVHMAFNLQRTFKRLGQQGGPWEWGACRAFTPAAEFFREYNSRYFTGTDNKADVAVLRSWPSMAYSIGPTLVPAILMEQVLIQHKIPFDIITDEKIGTIGRYQAVILPGQESLSMEMVDRLLAFVRDGGTLVFTGNTADYNEWRQRRAVNPLRSLPAALGRGRLVYIPAIIPAEAGQSEADAENPEIVAESRGRSHTFPPARWVLPRNHEEIRRAVADSLPRGLSVTAGAPATTVLEILNRAESRETILHFVNFDRANRLKPFEVSLAPQFPGKVSKLTFLTWDADDPRTLPFRMSGGRVAFTVPEMSLYGMAVVSWQGN